VAINELYFLISYNKEQTLSSGIDIAIKKINNEIMLAVTLNLATIMETTTVSN